ncbi:replication initiation protein [Sporosarcina aquimarina]|uniref:replication initiation protein n=1 Tax=Sporosarcina aquimarina TaxID=114975 RepID=UPI002041AB69|nr:replication initiation protein [Sporosarcina aquimarina]MCM3759149.1 replication initiation protein [Sporosarcina aquimarina]
MEENYLVTQSNNLIEARHKKPLTAREQKIVLSMVGMIQPSDEDFKDYRISVKSFSEMLGLKGSVKYTQMKGIAENLMSKTVEIPKKNGGWILANWISSAEYKEGEGVIELSFSPKLKPYMLQLKNQFTSYRLSNILNLNSTYSIRLYELMKKWQHLGKWGCSVEDLRGKLGVGEKIYPRYANLKARVLAPAIAEVNEKTDLFIRFNEIKNGRSVERIEFIVQFAPEKEIKIPEPKKKLEQPKKAPENEEIRIRLNHLADKELYQFDPNYFSQMYEAAFVIWEDQAESELTMIIRYVNVEESVKKPLGFIKSQIKLAWEASERGEQPTFANLQPTKKRVTGRQEIIPDWFKEKDENIEPTEKEPDAEVEKKRQELQKKLNDMRKEK